MQIRIEKSMINRITKFLGGMKYSEYVKFIVKPDRTDIFFNDLVIFGKLELPVVSDEDFEFVIRKDVLTKILDRSAGDDIVFKMDEDGSLKVYVGRTELNISVPMEDVEIEAFRYEDHTEVSLTRMVEIIENLSVSKSGKSFMINVMEISEQTKYGCSTHFVLYDTQEFAKIKSNVTHEFIRAMSVITKVGDGPIKIMHGGGDLVLCNNGAYLWTKEVNSEFTDVQSVLDQPDDIVAEINITDSITKIWSTLSKLSIPLTGLEVPISNFVFDKNGATVTVTDIGNRQSNDEIKFDVKKLGEYRGVSLNLITFASIMDKPKRANVSVKIKDSVIVITDGYVQDIILKHI